MNYNEVKKHVLSTSHNLGLLPGKVVSTLLNELSKDNSSYWDIPDITDIDFLTNITDPRITCILHTMRDNTRDEFTNYRVCTITIDDVAAFFYVGVHKDCASGHVYVLDVNKTKAFLQMLVLMQLDTITNNAQTDITEATELEALTELYDVDIEYEVEPNEPRGVYCF